jgi:uncharacterized protein (DUF1697 family)
MKYVALLRGIGPSNPNMHPQKLKWCFEKLGFKNVKAVISSGNVVFESNLKNVPVLETKIEKALPKFLKFKSTTIIRSQEELQRLVDKDPFRGRKHNNKTYLVVTFLKNKPSKKLKYDRVVCNIVNLTSERTPDIMTRMEKEFGKEITTRTWKTVERILSKFSS